MNMENIISQLKMDGVTKGLCRLWQIKLSKENITMEELAQLYFKGIDFCISKDFPTLDFLRQNFKGKCEPYGVFIDDPCVRERNREDLSLNGDCKADLFYSGYSVSRVFARHTSEMNVTACGSAHLTVDIFDDVKLAVSVIGSKARVLVNVYGSAQVQSTGNVKVVNKKIATYE